MAALLHGQHDIADRAEGDREARRAHLDRFLADIGRRLTDADRAAMTTDDLYDETGLPR